MALVETQRCLSQNNEFARTLSEAAPQSTANAPAKITWEPNLSEFRTRCVRAMQVEGLKKDVPTGFPSIHGQQSPECWSGQELNESSCMTELSPSEKLEIQDALAKLQDTLKLSDINKSTFPLPVLGPKLTGLASSLYNGTGFITLRGWDAERYSVEDNIRVFLGVSSYFGEQRGRQDDQRNKIAHILDAKTCKVPENQRMASWTNVAQPYHSDIGCELLALFSLSRASIGGASHIASVRKIYNELAMWRPDILHTLAQGNWPFDTFGLAEPYYQRALLFCEDDHVMLNFARRNLTGSSVSPRTPGIPSLTERQAEALDAVHFLATEFQLSTQLMVGDMRFINNFAVVHARDSFVDEGESRRHLLRLWLRNETLAWPAAEGLKPTLDWVYDGDQEDDLWPTEPNTDESVLLQMQKSCGNA